MTVKWLVPIQKGKWKERQHTIINQQQHPNLKNYSETKGFWRSEIVFSNWSWPFQLWRSDQFPMTGKFNPRSTEKAPLPDQGWIKRMFSRWKRSTEMTRFCVRDKDFISFILQFLILSWASEYFSEGINSNYTMAITPRMKISLYLRRF